MPPKKAATSSIVGEYDIELMNIDELREYVKALEEEHKRMREAKNLYQKDKNELLNCLKCVQENIIDKKGVAIQKNVEIQKHMNEAEKKSQLEDQLNKITELENYEKAAREIFESFTNIESTQVLHKEKENALMQDIAERDRQIQDVEFISKLMPIELTENNLEKFYDLSVNSKSTFESFLIEWSKKFHRNLEEFSESKIDNLRTIFEHTVDINGKSFVDVLEEMTEYFKDVYWKNLKTIEELNNKIIDLKKELNTTTLNTRDVTRENDVLRELVFKMPSSPASNGKLTQTFSSAKITKLEDFTYENYVLTIKLEMINREYNELKEKFICAVRKIYQTADFKALLLESKLLCLQNPSESVVDAISNN